MENTINPETNEPYLKKVEVRLFGESEKEAIVLPPYLKRPMNMPNSLVCSFKNV